MEVDVLMQYVPGLRTSKAFMALAEFRDNTFVLNYSFVRSYRDRKPLTDWRVRKLNYFSHLEETQEQLK